MCSEYRQGNGDWVELRFIKKGCIVIVPKYFIIDCEHPISEQELSKADRKTQLDVMEAWFRQHYEDPAERTPYESAEGGYIWIWGGPYYAREELESEFAGIVPDDVIDELVDKLEQECIEWAPTTNADDYDEYLLDDIASLTDYYSNFMSSIHDIEMLLRAKVDNSVSHCLMRLLYVNVITVLETYLSDAFINTVMNDSELMRRFIETNPDFQGEKISISDIYKVIEEIEKKARTYLIELIWHRLDRVKPMYEKTLGIKFPDDISTIFRAILIRHDIVHRNGKTRDGREIIITQEAVTELTNAVKNLVQYIDTQLPK